MYISQDPIGLTGGMELYSYVFNPNSWIDTLGLTGCSDNQGRKGRQKKLKDLLNDPKTPRYVKGWIKQELNAIAKGKRKTIRNPKGFELAHERGREAAKGYGYENSNLQNTDLHKLQHKYDDSGRMNKDKGIRDKDKGVAI